MNLNNIKLELLKLQEEIYVINIYLDNQLLPIKMLKGIKYFIYEDKEGKAQEIILNKYKWFVCVFSSKEENHYIQDEISFVDAEKDLYQLINNPIPSRKQFNDINTALQFSLNSYIRFLFIQFNKFANTKIRCKNFSIIQIKDLLKREKITDKYINNK